jgi:hypothetical protein
VCVVYVCVCVCVYVCVCVCVCVCVGVPPEEAPHANKSLVSAAAFIHDVRLTVAMATAVGNHATAKRLQALAEDLASEFNRGWLVGGETYASGLQTEISLPLWLDIVSFFFIHIKSSYFISMFHSFCLLYFC